MIFLTKERKKFSQFFHLQNITNKHAAFKSMKILAHIRFNK